MTIHHTLTKKAAKHGATITEAGEQFWLVRDEDGAQAGPYETAKDAANAAPDAEYVAPPTGKRGAMAKVYHDRYMSNPHGPGCNDDLDCALRTAFVGDAGLDVEALRDLGEALGLWNPAWEDLNPGMRRMNLANRIRGYLRRSPDNVVEIDGKVGRFGVEYNPPAKRAKKSKKVEAIAA